MQNEQWVPHQKACAFYGVSINTLRQWADSDKVIYKRKPSGHRVYLISSNCSETRKTPLQFYENIIYCRVSSNKQKDDLNRQCQFLLDKYPGSKIIKDIGSGLNYKRKGLLKLLELSNNKRVNQIIISSKDRLCRFGFELIEWQLLQNNTKILVQDKTDKTPEQEFTEDILSILQVFACRWNGKRKYTITNKNKKNQIEVELNTDQVTKQMES